MSVLEGDLTREQCEAICWRDGYEDGKEAGIREIAANLKKSGIPIDIIVANTGFTEEEIEAL